MDTSRIEQKNPWESPKFLMEASTHPESQIRMLVSINPATPTSALRLLALDISEDVRGGAAANRNTPLKALDLLSYDGNSRIRREVGVNVSTPLKTLLRLLGDDDHFVVHTILGEPVFQQKMLAQAVEDGLVKEGITLPLEWLLEAYNKTPNFYS